MKSRLLVFPSMLLAALSLLAACDSEPSTGHSDIAEPDAGDLGDASDIDGPDALDAAPDRVADPRVDLPEPDTDRDPTTSDAADLDMSDGLDAGAPSPFRTCMGRPLEHEIDAVWANPYRSEILEEMTPGHSVEDLIVTRPAAAYEVEGKFAYGELSIDLESEWITAFVDDCTQWIELGREETDSDGRAAFEVPPDLLEEPGRYEVRMIVEGDGTTASGNLLVVPPETRFVVFDIDGTLTTGDSELFIEFFADLFGGDYVPDAYADADAVTQAYATQGYALIYLTGRPYWLDDVSREWLSDGGFPVGTVHFTRTLSESMPNDDGVGAYKRDYLAGVAADHVLFRAYGNATTDIFGYLEAGLSGDDIFIIGEHAGEDGTQAVANYADHLSTLEIPPADQPWENER